MDFYTITARSNFIDNSIVNAFHSGMFHGLAERDGKEHPHDTKVRAYTDSPSRLIISRTGRSVPAISKPSSHLVVGERYAQMLESIPHIRLWPVEFKRLVDVDYQNGDNAWFKAGRWVEPRDLLRSLPDVPAFHQIIGKFFEVQTWRWQDIVDRFPDAHEVKIEEGTPPMAETVTLRISDEMLREFPMFWFGDIVLDPQVFSLLRDGLNTDYFIVRKYAY